MITHLDTAELTDLGDDRVQIRGVRGSAPPATTKVAITGVGGWENSVLLALTGTDLDAKAALVERSVHRYIEAVDGLDAVAIDRIGQAQHDPDSQNAGTELLRIAVQGTKDAAGRAFSSRMVELALSSYPGLYSLGPPQPGSAFGVYWPALLDQALLDHVVHHHDGTTEIIALGTRRSARGRCRRASDANRANDHGPTNSSSCHSVRSCMPAPATRVATRISVSGYVMRKRGSGSSRASRSTNCDAFFPKHAHCPSTRYELPNFGAVNFLIRGLLGTGATSITAAGRAGKSTRRMAARTQHQSTEISCCRRKLMSGPDESTIDVVRKATQSWPEASTTRTGDRRTSCGEYPWEFVKAFAQGGWLGALIPEEYGGLGLGIAESGVMMQEIAASGAGASGASAVHFYLFPPEPIIRHGSAAMKQEFLPKLARGEILMAFGVTEPTAGVDTSRIRTKAEKVDGGWVVNGQKVWISNAQNAHKILLLARTSPRNEDKPLDGMTLFFTDLNRERITVREIEKLGRSAIDSNELFIEDLEVGDDEVVGQVGRGFKYLIDGLNSERIVVGLEGVGIGQAALELATNYANERVVFDRPIGQNQAVAHPLADSWIRLEAARLTAMHAAELYDHHQNCGLQAAAAKYLGAEAGFDACDRAMSTHGGYAYAKEYHVERLWREARLLRNAPFSQEMVLNYISTQALKLPRAY